MKLPPEVNLLAVVHYMQALDYQRRANQIVGILGSKTPHIQNLAVGGVANPINPESQSTLTLERLYKVKALIDQIGDFVNQVYLPDVAAIGALYAEWTRYGSGVTNYLSVPDMPLDTKSTHLRRCRAATSRTATSAPSSRSPITGTATSRQGVKESAKHAWYRRRRPASLRGQDRPQVRRLRGRRASTPWVKAPTFYDARAGRPARQRPGHVRLGTRADEAEPRPAAGDRRQGRRRRAAALDRALDDRPARRPRRPLRRPVRDAGCSSGAC